MTHSGLWLVSIRQLNDMECLAGSLRLLDAGFHKTSSASIAVSQRFGFKDVAAVEVPSTDQ
jgi:hypothetical protein